MVGRWAEKRKVPFAGFADLSQNEDVYRLIEAEIDRINATLPPYCRVARFINLFKQLDADEGELTRSQKLRRPVVAQKYKTLIDALYGDESVVETSIEVRFQDGRSRSISADIRIWSIGGTSHRLEPAKPAEPQLVQRKSHVAR